MSGRAKPGQGQHQDPGGKLPDARFQRGRQQRYPFSMLPDWVGCAAITPGAKALYWALFMHVNQDRRQQLGDMTVWPGQRRLLAISGIKSKTTLRKYLRELEEITAVDSVTGPNPLNPMRQQTVYTVHEVPVVGYTGPRSMDDVPDPQQDEQGP
ncbi:hypothetical protein [Streptomyces sp. NPDC050428]|uniref:hypothetical protein n=1 Tax=Streptomyces sp. NPDC050428 TaxID=3155757 RepID=UPI003427D4AD